jgi:uridine kinase
MNVGKIISEIDKNPFVIGIAGGTGSGKSFYAEKLKIALVKKGHEVLLIKQDDFAIGRHFKNKLISKYKYDDPENYRIDELINIIKQLKSDKAVNFLAYDLKNHEPTEQKTIQFVSKKPKIIIIEGIYAWYGNLKRNIDYKIFIDVDINTRFILRANRNVNELKINNFELVTKMFWTNAYYAHRDFVEPMSRSANLIMKPKINLHSILVASFAKTQPVESCDETIKD